MVFFVILLSITQQLAFLIENGGMEWRHINPAIT